MSRAGQAERHELLPVGRLTPHIRLNGSRRDRLPIGQQRYHFDFIIGIFLLRTHAPPPIGG